MNVLSIFLTIGLPAIDESLDKLLVAMETFPNVAVLGDAVGLARIIGCCLPLCRLLRVLDDDTRTARHGCNEAAPYCRHLHLYLFLVVDLLRIASTGQGIGVSHQSDGKLQKQGGGCFRAEGSTKAE